MSAAPPRVPTLALTRCPLCEEPLGPEAFSTTYTDLWDNDDGHRYGYRPCATCDVLVLANPPEPGPALAEFYDRRGGCSFLDWRHPNPVVRAYTRSVQRRKMALLRPIVQLTPASRVMEVGTGKGAFAAYLAEEVGCEVHANDLAPDPAHPGVRFHPGPFESLGHLGRTFDLVISHQVIEHVYDPRAFLEAGYALLRPGGVMVVETINTRCTSFRLFRDDWSQLCAPRHTVLYTDRFFAGRVAAMLGDAGVEVRYEGYAAQISTWVSSAIHALHLPMATSRAALVLAGVLFLATNPWVGWLERHLGRERAIITVVIRKPG